MILRDEREQYDGSFRLVTYATDDDGKCVPELTKSDMDDVIDSYYVLRAEELERLQKQLVEGGLSPIGFFIRLQNMTVRETAPRVGVSMGRVKKHMTPEGFAGVKVKTLQRYAQVFDVAVADFFQFTRIVGNLEAKTKQYSNRLLQYVTVSIGQPTRGKLE